MHLGAGRPYSFSALLDTFFSVDVGEPSVPIGRLAVDDGEVGALQLLRHRSSPAVADGDLVDRSNRRHLGGRAGDEDLVGDIQRFTWNAGLENRVAEIACQRDDRIPRDAAKD